jgi:ABC-2 type transport system ATP-binding protein
LARADGLAPADAPVDAVLAFAGLTDAAERKVSGWSTGMLQRLGLAAALLRQPRLLILDEPTEGLDPTGSREVIDLLRLVASDGVTVLLSSHDMLEVDSVCDSATVINQGEVAMSGPLTLLRSAAPPGRLRMTTSDDDAALALAARFPCTADRHPLGGLSLEADPDVLHDFVCAMGQRDVSVTMLEQEIPPLTALFYDLTEGRRGRPGAL